MKIKITRHYIRVRRLKRHNNNGIPFRTHSFFYRDAWNLTMLITFLRWCVGSEKNI